ncbi:MAG: hypothetical protein Q4G16_07215 [Cruoricaptor ignavus]|nr:hypothetical protein [Cruoricaptor ignavus]
MKKNPALFGFIVSVIVFALAFGIYFIFLSKKNYYVVDNPTADTYYFRLNNGEENIISAGQYVKVELNKGKNDIKVYNGQKELLYDSAFTVNKIRGLVNISHSDYYTHRQYYGYNLKKDSLLAALPQTEIDGQKYYGDPQHFNQLYTDDFYYNIDEDYDKVIKNIAKIESRVKIFRKQDFLNYYKEYYNF